MISFGIKYWFLLLLVIVITSLGLAFLLYARNNANKVLSRKQAGLLFSLRFFSFISIAFLLLSPFIRNIKKIIQEPLIIAAWDNSMSVNANEDTTRMKNLIVNLRNELSRGLQKDFELAEYSFGEGISNFETFTFSQKKSDYSALINFVKDNHQGDNIGALIIGGDGIFNEGKNPLNMVGDLNFPVYSIGFGDTTEWSDAGIRNIYVNRTTFSGNRFPVEIEAQFSKLTGTPVKLSVMKNGNELKSSIITPSNSNFYYTARFLLDADEPGLHHYEVELTPVGNEKNTENNHKPFVINVLENRQKILIVSEGPHPDIGSIKNVLEEQKSYDISLFTEEPYPNDLADFNLCILNQLPTPGKSVSKLLNEAEKNRIPVLFMVGNKTYLPQLSAVQEGAEIKTLAGSSELAQPVLNKAYATFNLSDDFTEAIPGFPPLQVPFADIKLDPELMPLFFQKIMSLETSKPLIATGRIQGRKTGFIFGEGIWRWRLYDYYTNHNHSLFNELVNKLVQYLATRENEDNFIISYDPVYAETDDVEFTAELYNDVYEYITTEEIRIELSNADGELYPFTFDIRGDRYYLNTGNLPRGDYSFISTVTIGNETFEEKGSFTVLPVNIENLDTKANHNLLYRISEQTGGKFYLPSGKDLIIQEISDNSALKPVSYFQEMVHELLNLKWLFFVFILLLSLEWFLRKYWGIY